MANPLNELTQRLKKSVTDFDEAQFARCVRFVDDRLTPDQKERLALAFETVRVLYDLHPDREMLLAVILHALPPAEMVTSRLQREFGTRVAALVSNLAKIEAVRLKTDEQFGLVAQMLMAMADDLRVVVILLADRLCRLRRLEQSPVAEKEAFARETLAIYAPIAGRLGIFALKGALEDLSFTYLKPEDFAGLKEQMLRLEAYRDRVIQNAGRRLRLLLRQNNITGQVLGRAKNYYSLYRKLQTKGETQIDAVHDIFAMRVIVSSVAECYAVLGILHEHFIPLPNRFKDYIAAPKPNGYQSLHTTVIGLAGITRQSFPIEVQIRTQAMDIEAEYGIAAHWHYKEKGSNRRSSVALSLSDLSLAAPALSKSAEAIALRGELAKEQIAHRIFTLTPNGDIINLPEGATPIDFAFAIHSELGLKTRIAKVNGKAVPIGHHLQNGDIVEIIGGKDAQPNQSWLNLAVTHKAKAKLRAFFRERDSATLFRDGKALLNQQLAKAGLPELDQNLTLLRNLGGKTRAKKDREDLLIKVGNGTLSPGRVMRMLGEQASIIVGPPAAKETAPVADTSAAPVIMIGGWPNVPYRFADCCQPKSGQRIIGFVTRGTHVTIHHVGCRTLDKLDQHRFIEAYFKEDARRSLARLHIFERAGHMPRLNDLTEKLTRLGLPVKNLFLRSGLREKPGMILELEIHDSAELLSAITELEEISWIEGVKLVQKQA